MSDATFPLIYPWNVGLRNQGNVSTFLSLARIKWHWETATVLAEFSTGKVQRRAMWDRPRLRIAFDFAVLNEYQMQALTDFFARHKGSYEGFWVLDWIKPNHGSSLPNDYGYRFGVGDGKTMYFKLPIDGYGANTLQIFVNGEEDHAFGVQDYCIVNPTSVPAVGEALTYKAQAVKYRMRFASDSLPCERYTWLHWACTFELVQEVHPVEE